VTTTFIHPTADVQTSRIGEGTRVWQNVVILPGARIGASCNVSCGCFIENDVVLGDNVTIKNGVSLYDGVRLEDDVFVGPNATFTNDPMPRSGHRSETFLHTVVRRGASIGANATLLPGITIGEGAMVAAGSVVTRDVPAGVVVMGNPARVKGSAKDKSL
jgi:UDP-2-acetamido-3-amino-2,3-dideoxy-glucuronate N-acetyltransferase